MSKLRKSARGRECTLQIHPYCSMNVESVVLCHIGSEAKGMGIKSPDWWSAYGCSSCHDVIDGRMKTDLPETEILKCIMRGIFRTHQIMLDEGLLKVG